MKKIKVYDDETLINPEFLNQMTSTDLGTLKRRMKVVTCFSTLFAKWEIQEDGLLIQMFPRAGAEDEWYEGQYTQQCAQCGRWRRDVTSQFKVGPCPGCGSTRLVYRPGRGEVPTTHKWMAHMLPILEEAADKIFMGDVKFDYVEELDSWVLLFQKWRGDDESLSKARGPLDIFLESVDNRLTVLAESVGRHPHSPGG